MISHWHFASLVFPGTGADAGGGGGGLDGGHHEDAGRAPEVLGVVPGLAGVPLPRGGAHPRGGETLHRHDGKSNWIAYIFKTALKNGVFFHFIHTLIFCWEIIFGPIPHVPFCIPAPSCVITQRPNVCTRPFSCLGPNRQKIGFELMCKALKVRA